MKCKKCRKQIPDNSKFCNHCGAKQENQKLYRRPDGLYEKIITINGKRKAFRGKTEKEVFSKIAEYDVKQQTGPLFTDLVDIWEEEYCSQLSPTTRNGYKASKNYAIKFFKGVYVKDIQPYDIQEFAESLPKSFSKNTINNYVSTVSSILSFAVRSRDFPINFNPCNNAKIRIGQEPQERRIATDEEINIIMNNIDKPFGLFAVFLLFTGCRRGEALALEWKDIDFKKETININKSLTWQNCRPFLKSPKTKCGNRSIILLPELKKYLPTNKYGLVFPSLQGTLMTENQYAKMWDKYYKLSGLKAHNEKYNLSKLTAHCLRHGYATILYEANVDVKEAQRLLGHAKETTTREIYTHITERSKDKNTEKLKIYVNEHFKEIIEKSS